MNDLSRSTAGGFMRHDEADAFTGLSNSTRRLYEARGAFPHRVPIPGSPRLTGYIRSEVFAWFEQRVAELRKGARWVEQLKQQKQATGQELVKARRGKRSTQAKSALAQA